MNVKRKLKNMLKSIRIKKAIDSCGVATGFLTTKEVCAFLDISELMLNRLYAAGEIEPKKVGGFILWDWFEVNRVLSSYKASPAA